MGKKLDSVQAIAPHCGLTDLSFGKHAGQGSKAQRFSVLRPQGPVPPSGLNVWQPLALSQANTELPNASKALKFMLISSTVLLASHFFRFEIRASALAHAAGSG